MVCKVLLPLNLQKSAFFKILENLYKKIELSFSKRMHSSCQIDILKIDKWWTWAFMPH